jgi:hypothetical protein
MTGMIIGPIPRFDDVIESIGTIERRADGVDGDDASRTDSDMVTS